LLRFEDLNAELQLPLSVDLFHSYAYFNCSAIANVHVSEIVRYFSAMYKCQYAFVKRLCNVTAAFVYTTFQLKTKQRWLAAKKCSVSE